MTDAEDHVRSTDAFTMQLERDPLLRVPTVGIVVLDRAPDWSRLRERVERASRLAPRFRMRVQPTPFNLAPPRWVVDDEFDLSFHLRRLRVPDPGTFAEVVDFARTTAMTDFDRDRPRWELTLLEGLDGDRAALVMKVHHVLTDGIGGVQVMYHAVDLAREGQELGPLPEPPAPSRPEPLGGLLEALGFEAHRAVGSSGDLLRWSARTAFGTARAPRRSMASAATTAVSVARFLRPVTTTRSPVMRERRRRWTFQTLDVPFAPLRGAAKQIDGKLNDGFLAGVTGGLRRYHELHGASVGDLCVTMPVSMRTEADPVGGNKITLVRVEVPVGEPDPRARMHATRALTAQVREDPAIQHSDTLAGVLNLLPVAVTGEMLKHVDFLASNVPGFPVAVYLAGARVDAFYPFGPTLGSSVNVTLMSYRHTCNIGITSDDGAVPDPAAFLECLRAGFDEVLALDGPGTPDVHDGQPPRAAGRKRAPRPARPRSTGGAARAASRADGVTAAPRRPPAVRPATAGQNGHGRTTTT